LTQTLTNLVKIITTPTTLTNCVVRKPHTWKFCDFLLVLHILLNAQCAEVFLVSLQTCFLTDFPELMDREIVKDATLENSRVERISCDLLTSPNVYIDDTLQDRIDMS